jgi:glycosyl transferase family 87
MCVLYISRNTNPDGTPDGILVPSAKASRIKEVKEQACAHACSAIKYGMMQQEMTDKQPSGEAKKAGITLWDRLLARQGIMAYLPIIVSVILLFLGASWEYFQVHAAVAHYACYALTFWRGGGGVNLYPPVAHCNFLPAVTLSLPPFHALPLEYPPLSLVLFSLALFAPLHYYTIVFAILIALTIVFIYWLLLRYAPRGAGLAFAIYMLIGAWAIAVGRFDLVPAALTLICVIAAERKRWTYAYITLAFAFLLKIYPLLFLPALFIAEQQDARCFYTPQQPLNLASLPGELWQTLRGIRRWRWKNTFIFFALLFVVTGFFALLNFQGAVLNQLSYFANRPVQIESTGSPILFLGAHFGYPVQNDFSFGSYNVVSRLERQVEFFLEVLFVAGYLYALFVQWRGKLDITQTFIAILLVFIVTGKVFSPQYLMWLIPLLAYSGAYNRSWLIVWVPISLLTTYIFPYIYTRPLGVPVLYKPGFIESVTARNTLLAFLTLAYLFNWWQLRSTRYRRRNGVRSSTHSGFKGDRQDHHAISAPVPPYDDSNVPHNIYLVQLFPFRK